MKSPWSLSPEEAAGELDVTQNGGLTHREARKRLKQFGPNRLRDAPRKSVFAVFVSQIKNLIVLLLAVACGLAFVFGQALEGISIAVVLILNTAIGFFTELRAVRSMEALKKMTRTKSKVRRGGRIRTISAENLVPGDLVAFEGGDLVGADLRLIEASRILADESALTGESMPVGKVTEALGEETPLADRKNMLFKGTAVTGGAGEGIVVATGMKTELGRISSMVEETEKELSSLEKRLNRLGYRLVWITLATAVLLGFGGVFSGMDPLLIVETAIALAVAAIPEGLPIVATLALARGMWRMAERNALINRLSAVETLGSTGVICTDKTGTLTENRLTARRMIPASRLEDAFEIDLQADPPAVSGNGERIDPQKDPCFLKAVRIGVLCNNAGLADGSSADSDRSAGDPLEIALLSLGAAFDVRRGELLENMPEVREDPFDPREARMATFHKQGGELRVAVKGSPESVLKACRWFQTADGKEELGEDTRKLILERNDEMAGDGLRNLALAEKTAGGKQDDPYEDLVFVGLVGFLDPPRHEVKDAIAVCRKAGIRTIMVTGDHPVTARNVARSLGLVENDDASVIHGAEFDISDTLSEDARKRYLRSSIFARIDPAQKLDLIDLQQKNGAVVAMTGDGVNDAPALKKADIGIAMGRRGTQVAREAADMILKDDSFKTVAVAVAQGRAIFDNIRKFILFLLSGNTGEIMIVAAAVMAGESLPLLPLQILYLNMIGDVFPALALGLGKENDSIMEKPPRKSSEPILPRSYWVAIAGYGALIAASVLGTYAVGLEYFDMDYETAVTVSFLTLAFARLLHTFNMRDRESRMLRNEVTRNSYVWQALALSTLLLLAAVFTGTLSNILRLTVPGMTEWVLIIAGSLIPLLVGQAVKGIRGRRPAAENC